MVEDILFFFEIFVYDEKIVDVGFVEYVKVKLYKVIGVMKVFLDLCFNIDVLKVEVFVNIKYVEGFVEGEVVYIREEAAVFFKV